jgi:hypothetical protein
MARWDYAQNEHTHTGDKGLRGGAAAYSIPWTTPFGAAGASRASVATRPEMKHHHSKE